MFELTGTFGDGVQVSYFSANDEPLVEVAGLPWSTAFDYNGRALADVHRHPSRG